MSRKEVLVAVLVIAALVGILVPMVGRARLTAQRLSSQNNLKQLSLAVSNYESGWRRLPPGCDARGNHGWSTFIQPLMEASDLYSRIDLEQSWEHPVNRYLFLGSHPAYLNPLLSLISTEEGYGLTHYEANASVFHQNSAKRLEEIDAGRTWCFAEVFEDFKPKPYPFTWRSSAEVFQSAERRNVHQLQIAMLDGSVRVINPAEDSGALELLRDASPVQAALFKNVPVRQFVCTDQTGVATWETVAPKQPFDEPFPRKGGPSYWSIYSNADPAWTTLKFWLGTPHYTTEQLEETILAHPEIQTVIFAGSLNDEVCDILLQLPNLSTLKVAGGELSESSRLKLSEHETLQIIGL